MRSTTRRAFTLIELLTVIAIIAILASILFPVFAKAREKAEQTHCLNNVKQLDLSFNMYATDYDSRLPMVSSGLGTSPTGSARVASAVPQNWATVLNSYTKNDQILICPDTTIDGQTFDSTQLAQQNCGTGNPGVSYGMTASLDAAKITRITYPGSTVLLFDAITDNNACYGDAGPNVGNVGGAANGAGVDRIRANHLGDDPGATTVSGNGYGCFGFADGHAKVLMFSAVAVPNASLSASSPRFTK
jgi:prepilin-type N-terminal cleavage/methylation domain-containing protein